MQARLHTQVIVARMLSREYLVTVATMVRRFKSDYKMSLGQRLTYLRISSSDNMLLTYLQSAEQDLMSVTRAEHIEFNLVSDELKLTHEKLSISIV